MNINEKLPRGMVPPRSVEAIEGHLRAGGIIVLPSNEGARVFNIKTLESYEKAGLKLFKASGEGYQIRMGRRSVFAFHGSLIATSYAS